MGNTIEFSEVQLLNLSYLMAIQASIRKDPVAACYIYRLSADQAPKIAEMGPEKIQTVVANLGSECLCTPRHDLLQLVDAPPGLLGPLAAVRAPDATPQVTKPADRRRRNRS
jgi:hypothetical protein